MGYEDEGVKEGGVIKIPGGGTIIFDITLLEVEDGQTHKLYQWVPPPIMATETSLVSTDCWTKVQMGNFISLVYYAWFIRNEWKIFSKSDHKSGYLRYKVGDGTVIKGLEQGIVGTCIGEGRRIVIPPEVGFGVTGSLDGTIPANTTVIYDVQVLDISNENPWIPPQNVFKSIDSNGDQNLSYEEMSKFLKSELIKRGEHIPKDDSNHMGAVRSIFVKEDINLDKQISWDEFSGPKTDDHMEL